jgi:hypothetical protein
MGGEVEKQRLPGALATTMRRIVASLRPRLIIERFRSSPAGSQKQFRKGVRVQVDPMNKYLFSI